MNAKIIKTMERSSRLRCAGAFGATLFSFSAAFAATDGNLLRDPGFEHPELGLVGVDSKEWKIVDGAGRGGSKALVWEDAGVKPHPIAVVKMPELKAGQRAHVEFWVKDEALKGGEEGVAIEFYHVRTHEFVGGSGTVPRGAWDTKEPADAAGWRKRAFDVARVPTESDVPVLEFMVGHEVTGKVCFDDVSVTVVDERYVEEVTSSPMHREAASGPVTFAAQITYDMRTMPADRLTAEFDYLNAAGKKVVARADRVDPSGAFLTLDATNLAVGAQAVGFVLKDPEGRQLGSGTTHFRRLAEEPKRAVTFDRFGRTIVDGKPFFPLGMYWHDETFSKTPERLDHYAKGPFNCLLNYENAMTCEELDAYWAKGLRVVVAVNALYSFVPDFLRPKGVVSRADDIRYIANVVRRCKDHPALLAWYVGDEIKEMYQEEFLVHYEVLKELDRAHPQFLCLGNVSHAARLINGFDVVGVDSYPIGLPVLPRKLAEVDKGAVWMAGDGAAGLRKFTMGVRPRWDIPQAFAWKWDYAKDDWRRFPTYRELRSMLWQMIAEGSNGLLLYAYGQMLREWGTPDFEKNWDAVCRACAEVKKMIPVLLLEPGPKLASPKGARVRTWQEGENLYVLVCNKNQERCEGAIDLPGKYEASETIGEGVRLEGGRLLVDLKSMDYAIIRLKGKAG